MKIVSMAVCALFLAAGAGAKSNQKPDAWITTKVKSSLAAHKNVSALGTSVETKNGVVTLTGEVDTMAEKDLAGRYVSEVQGVRGVNNRLVVKGENDGGERRGNDERGAGDDRWHNNEHPGEGAATEVINDVGDSMLTGKVKAALAGQRATSAVRTKVDTERGHVTLHGTAKSDAERDLAEKVVRDVKGVKSVDNEIEVK